MICIQMIPILVHTETGNLKVQERSGLRMSASLIDFYTPA